MVYFIVFTDGPTVDYQKSSKFVKTWLRKAVQLRCFGDGVPVPTVQWWHPNGSVMTINFNQLNITPTSDDDFGTYNCIIYNGVGKSLRHPIVLQQISMKYLFIKFRGKFVQETKVRGPAYMHPYHLLCVGAIAIGRKGSERVVSNRRGTED